MKCLPISEFRSDHRRIFFHPKSFSNKRQVISGISAGCFDRQSSIISRKTEIGKKSHEKQSFLSKKKYFTKNDFTKNYKNFGFPFQISVA